MTKYEFNSMSLLQIENEGLRERLKAKDKEIEVLKMTIQSLIQIIKKSDEENLAEPQKQ